ncbi:MAG: type II toxin-antitoxin system RelE/ParE family toxin [Cyclobacteriaceae bacterium]|nr:type II toxin-antitoxin system RelE/ParE family toxin [Cyclobacteriaceae bacterium]
MAKVVWTDSAIYDLNDIGEYISKDSVKYAEITVERLFNAVDILEKYPDAGKMVPELGDKLIRELIRGSYRIVYRKKNDKRIDILIVHNSARMLGNTYDFDENE